MTENKRYYQRDFEELYYIIDSNVISEKEFDERVEYDGYTAFEDSMSGDEIVKLLNENELLKEQRKFLFTVINEVLPHSGSITVLKKMEDRGIGCDLND